METTRDKHQRAMEILDEVLYNKDPEVRKDKKALAKAAIKAFALEKEAAQEIPLDKKNEPTRSVLYRSAGWIAIDANSPKDALEMALEGLKGAIHDELIAELNELKEEAEKLIKG